MKNTGLKKWETNEAQQISVLHIVNNLALWSGIVTVVANYYRHIDHSKFVFSFVYFDDVRKDTYAEELRSTGAGLYYIPRKEFVRGWRQFCKDHAGEFDILHNHETFIAPLLVDAKKSLRVRKIITHAHATKFSDSLLKSIRNAVLSYPCRAGSDAFLACSREAGTAIFGKAFENRGQVLKNAIDMEKYRFNDQVRLQLRNALHLENAFVIGHVGNMTPPKNHSFIIDIFHRYAADHPDAKLLLIGDGYLKDEIEKKAAALGLKNRILFTGVVSNVYDYLNAMDVFLFPSLFEGVGIAMIEAQANGLGCVYSDRVPAEADCNPDSNVKLSLKDTPAEWAAALDRFHRRLSTSSAVRDKGYDIVSAAGGLENYYRSLLNETIPQPGKQTGNTQETKI